MPFHIPKFWASVSGSARNPSDDDVALKCFSYSDTDVAEARAKATTILGRLVERVRAGEPWPDRYGYGHRPIREEGPYALPRVERGERVLEHHLQVLAFAAKSAGWDRHEIAAAKQDAAGIRLDQPDD